MEKILPTLVHRDSRGTIENISVGQWQEVNRFSSAKGYERGGHYHKKTLELIFVLSGEVELRWENTRTGDTGTIVLGQGEGAKIMPYERHWAKIVEDTEWISMLSIAFDQKNPDVFE